MTPAATADEVRRRVAANRLREAAQTLRLALGTDDAELSDELTGWQSALAELDKRVRTDDIAPDVAAKERRRLSQQLLAMLRSWGDRQPLPVFLSYHHGDSAHAQALRNDLEAQGIAVVMDAQAMAPGEAIDDFIARALRATQATVMLVSEDALASGWVGQETALGRAAESLLPSRRLIACSLDQGWLDADAGNRISLRLDERIASLDALLSAALADGRDEPALAAERSRLREQRHAIGGVLATLRGRLCLDMTPPARTDSMRRLVLALAGDEAAK